jgi:cyclase
MLAKRIIPCLDVTGGRVVKGVNFVELRDAGDPVEIAARYNDAGRRRAHLPGHHRHQRRPRPDPAHHRGRGQPGVHSSDGRRRGAHRRGRAPPAQRRCADKTSFNSAAIANPAGDQRDASAKYGAQCIVVAIDAKRRFGRRRATPGRQRPARACEGWDVYSHGGRKNTGLDAVAWATADGAISAPARSC